MGDSYQHHNNQGKLHAALNLILTVVAALIVLGLAVRVGASADHGSVRHLVADRLWRAGNPRCG